MKKWLTLNEPWVVSIIGYGTGEHAPGIKGIGTDVYEAGHNLIKAHAMAYKIYDEEFRQKQNGNISHSTPKKVKVLFKMLRL